MSQEKYSFVLRAAHISIRPNPPSSFITFFFLSFSFAILLSMSSSKNIVIFQFLSDIYVFVFKNSPKVTNRRFDIFAPTAQYIALSQKLVHN